MEIRKARKEDSAALVEFNQAMALETEGKRLDPETLDRGVNAVFDNERKAFYVVAEEHGRIVAGLMVTFEWSDWRDAWFWWIQSVYILPEMRGQRIYSRLYEYVKALAAANGKVCGFRLYVEKDNSHAQKVYRKVGMEDGYYLMFEEKI
jgi:GNAT superfamily N-acetyltransferase